MDHKSKKKKKGKEFDRNSKSLKYEMLKKRGQNLNLPILNLYSQL